MADVRTQRAFRQKHQPLSIADGVSVSEPEIRHTPSTEFSVGVEFVSPQRAREWLDRGGLNRSINRPFVDGLVAAIQRGEWRLTGDTIKLDREGKVRDGQHRLMAIIESDIPCRSVVVRNVEEDAFDVMDTGRSRSIADVLQIRGYANRNELGTTVRNLLTLERTGRIAVSTRDSRMMVTPVTTLIYLHKHPEVEKAVQMAMFVRKATLPGGVGLWASLLEMFRRVNAEETAEFTHRLVSGEGLERGDPILVLRNRLMQNSELYLTQGRKDREALAAVIIRTWNAWRADEEVTLWRQLEWKPDSAAGFPKPA